MKKIISVNDNQQHVDIAILLGRFAIGALMLVHGIPKLLTLIGEAPIAFPAVLGMSPGFSLGLAVFAEVFCSLFIIIGLGTRVATIPLIITMMVAVFYIHAGDPFAKQEMGILYLLAYLVLLISGSGKYSVDKLLQRKIFLPSFNGKPPVDHTLSMYK